MSKRHTDRPAVAIIIMIVAVAMLASQSAVVKLIGTDYHALQVAFIRNFVAVFVLAPFVFKGGGIVALRTKRPGLHLLRSVTGITGICCFFYAVQRLPVADVTVISQAVPLFVTALAVPFLKERVGWRRWSAVALGFGGVMLALGPLDQTTNAAYVAVAGTLLWSITILAIRSLGATENPATTTFYYMVFGTLAAGLAQPWVWLTPPDELWLLFVLAGVLGGIAQLLIAYSLKFGEASLVSPFNYTAIIWGIALDLALWSVWPSLWTLAGAGVITAAGLYIFRREREVGGETG